MIGILHVLLPPIWLKLLMAEIADGNRSWSRPGHSIPAPSLALSKPFTSK